MRMTRGVEKRNDTPNRSSAGEFSTAGKIAASAILAGTLLGTPVASLGDFINVGSQLPLAFTV